MDLYIVKKIINTAGGMQASIVFVGNSESCDKFVKEEKERGNVNFKKDFFVGFTDKEELESGLEIDCEVVSLDY